MPCSCGCDHATNVTCQAADYLPFVDASNLQSIVDMGLGIGAQFVGIPHAVYRVTSASNGDVIQPANLIFPNYMAQRSKYRTDNSKDIGLETLDRDDFIYSILGDMSPMLVGDIFVAGPINGKGQTMVNYPDYQINAFCIASLAVLKSRIAGRIDRQIQVYRPSTVPDAGGSIDMTLANCDQLVCVNGSFVLQDRVNFPDAVASKIPVGFQNTKRARAQIVSQTPNMPQIVSYACYVMPLPQATNLDGFAFREGDRIIDQDGSEYVVSNAYRQDTGFAGSQLTLDRYIAQS